MLCCVISAGCMTASPGRLRRAILLKFRIPGMIQHPDIDPVAFRLFDVWPVRWYGIMYLLAFTAAWLMARVLVRRRAFADMRSLDLYDFVVAGVIGVIAGGRLGYALFYNFPFYISRPHKIFYLWDGGMSFHGGLLGVIVALWIYSRRVRMPFLRLTDFAAVLTPVGLGLGRVANFINGELPGRIAPDYLPWGMIFPGDHIARHPSPLYQAGLEGVALGLFMWVMAARPRRAGDLSGLFLCGYGLCRMASEFFRQPDAHIGFLFDVFSLGQLLSLPMFLAGLFLLLRGRIRPLKAAVAACSSVAASARALRNAAARMRAALSSGIASLWYRLPARRRREAAPVAESAPADVQVQNGAVEGHDGVGETLQQEEEPGLLKQMIGRLSAAPEEFDPRTERSDAPRRRRERDAPASKLTQEKAALPDANAAKKDADEEDDEDAPRQGQGLLAKLREQLLAPPKEYDPYRSGNDDSLRRRDRKKRRR